MLRNTNTYRSLLECFPLDNQDNDLFFLKWQMANVILFQVLESSDNIVVSCDQPTCERLKEEGLPSDILWPVGLEGIWMRDVSRASIPYQIGFKYVNDYMPHEVFLEFQRKFDKAMNDVGANLQPRKDLNLDAGNIVDNFKDMALVGKRVLADKKQYDETSMKKYLEENTGYQANF